MLAYLKLLRFFLERKFGEHFCKMPPRKRIKRKSSHGKARMSTKAEARSPEVDELSCIPETQQNQQAAGVEELVVGVKTSPLLAVSTGQVSEDDCQLESWTLSSSSSPSGAQE